MNKLKIILIFVFIGTISVIGGAYFKMSSTTSHENFETKIFYNSITKNINNENVALSKFEGKWLLINFWATWCAPCREEIPELNEFYKHNDINLIAIAIDEIADVVKFQDEIPIQYPSFIANDIDGVRLTKNLGNSRGVLPFTVIVQPDGLVKKSFYGKVNISELNQALSDNSF